MELWRHASEGKGPVLCNEIDPTTSGLAKTRKVSMGWGTRKSYDFDSTLVSGRETIDSMEFMELGRPDVRGQSYISNQSLDAFGGEIGSNFSRKSPSPASMLVSNSSFGKYESGSSLSVPVTESNSQNSSLNVMTNLRQAKNCRSGFVLSSVGSSLTSKRARAVNLYSPNPICQVHGCNKDLSSSKDYHKRHKVCDVHSKTAKVIVNGIEQRFCQQCSRFHLLAEFDDGKRSCRKRLAGHNERRRKPQLDVLSGKPQKLLQVYEGPRFLQANSLAKRSSFASPDTLGSGSRGNELANKSGVKVEEVPICSPHLMMLTANRQLLSRPVFYQNGRGNEYSSEEISSQTGCASLGTASTIQAVSGVSNSKGALSLLSPQPKELLSHLTGIPMVSPLVMPGTNAPSYEDQISEIFEGESLGEKLSPNGFWPGMNSMAFDQLQPPLVFDASCGANSFEVQVGGVFQRSDSTMKSQSPQQGPTVDLVQLSLHLQRVEQQRNSVQMKQENDVFCSFPSI